MTCAVSQYGNDVVKNGNTWTRTLYAVWEEDAPAQPTPPDNDAVKALLGENAVQIICTNTQIGHGSKTFGLIDGTFTVYHSNNRCEVVINSFSPYVNEFNAAVSVPAGTHITDNSMAGQNRTKINLVWSDGKWAAADAPAKYHVLCSSQPAEPTAPGEGDLENIEKLVRIVCDRNIHDAKEYGVIAGSCEFGDIDMTGDVPTCPVTIQAAEYVKAYNGTIGVEHTITGDTERLLILAWDANNNVWRPMTDTPVTFTVICPPAKPGAEDLAKLESPVEVVCTTKPETHAAAHFSLGDGTYTIGDVAGNKTDGYTCDITVTADRYVWWYNLDYGKHTLTGDNTKTLTLKYVEGQWAVDTPVTFPVECETEPETTYTVTYTDGVENEEIFADQVYGNLLSGTATPAFNGTPTRAGYKFLGWEPTVAETVTENATYVAQWEKLYTVTYTDGVGGKAFKDDVHSDLEKDTKTPAYKDGIPTRKGFKFLGWEPEVADTVTEDVTYIAKWGELYTVTYTDGAKGKAFEDQVYENVLSGTKTPNFDGTPTRKGYKFVGWEPEVAETVTENVTYTAKWEELYTVTYTDGVNGKAFKDQVYSDLEAGTDTPKFDGKPTRKGYTFTGWSPKVTDTVTKDVTYVAQWKSVKNGKDNIPKTGDSEIVMVLGSVLLFSFCGAAAVSVYDRKRKHF